MLTSIALLAITAAAWVHVIWSAMGMEDQMEMETIARGLRGGVSFVAAWGVMMTAGNGGSMVSQQEARRS